MNNILKQFDLDETVIKHSMPNKKKKVVFDKTKDIVPPFEDYNFQADHIHMPTTKKGNKFILTIVDLATDECDFEPVPNEDSSTTLKAMKKIFKRPYLNKPYASLKTDSGKAFEGQVKDYLYNESILHSTSISGRHKQTGNIEAVNRQIVMVLNAYMNSQERRTGRTYREWDTFDLNKLRQELNKMRKKEVVQPGEPYDVKDVTDKLPMYNVNDLVHRKLDKPQDARGYFQNTENFRIGDIRFEFHPRKILQVLHYPNNIRYMLQGVPNVAYTEDELMPSEQKEEVFEVREIIGDKVMSGKKYYKVWWNGELKRQATWELETNLIEDGLEEYIEFYNDKKKKR